jgi:hypothetical protein
MNEAFDRDRLLELAELHCRGELSDEQQAELASMLRDQPDACAVFGHFLQLHANLEERLLAEAPLAAMLSTPAAVTPANFVRRQFTAAVRFFARPTPLSMSIAALVIGLIITGMAMVAPPAYRAIRQRFHPEESQQFVAHLTGQHNAVWADGQPALRTGQGLRAGRRVALLSGLAEVTYASGVRVVLEGDTSFHVLDGKSAQLDYGQAVARVPQGARGFEVSTKRFRVVDLGTEFGLAVSPAGGGEIAVFQGIVEVFAQRQRESIRRLFAGDCLVFQGDGQFVSGDAVAMQTMSKKLTRVLPRAGGLADDADYDQIVAALRPVAWYRMNRATGTQLIDNGPRASHGHVATQKGSPEFWQPGVLGESLALRGPQFGDYAVVTNYNQSRSGQLTVMAWVYAESGPPWATIAKNWGDAQLGQFHFGLNETGSHLSIYVQQTGNQQLSTVDAEPFPLGQWQHVAFVATGSKLRLYRNGNLAATSDCGPIAFPVDQSALGIGCKLSDAGDAPAGGAAGFWHGRIDELLIINSAVAQVALERCMAASQPPRPTPAAEH